LFFCEGGSFKVRSLFIIISNKKIGFSISKSKVGSIAGISLISSLGFYTLTSGIYFGLKLATHQLSPSLISAIYFLNKVVLGRMN